VLVAPRIIQVSHITHFVLAEFSFEQPTVAELQVRNSGGRRRCDARIAMGFFFRYVLKVINSAGTGG
jgi:hypothetical protein